MTFVISSFVLILQFFWNYIDDISGKGLGIFTILELVGYLSVHLVPLALPLSVLISSVMVMGNLSEKYELSSFKSAGVPLIRVMFPLIFLTIVIAIFSFIISNYMVPQANLKFRKRLSAIRSTRPALLLEEGAYNEDFDGFVIKIGSKTDEGKTLNDIIIYDHSNKGGTKNKITARTGEMLNENHALKMVLKNGYQYQQLKETKRGKKKYPFIITSFKQLHRSFDMSQFEIDEDGGSVNSKKYNMLNIHQLSAATDSLIPLYDKAVHRSLKALDKEVGLVKSISNTSFDNTVVEKDSSCFFQTFDSLNVIENVNFTKAISSARSLVRTTEYSKKESDYYLDQVARHLIEYHTKYSMAVACILFLFIGAPMGAIIRKGGFGWPMLISIVFFVLFIVINSFGKELAEEYVIEPFVGVWMPCFVLFPLGFILTYKAMNDSSFGGLSNIGAFFKKVFKKKEKKIT